MESPRGFCVPPIPSCKQCKGACEDMVFTSNGAVVVHGWAYQHGNVYPTYVGDVRPEHTMMVEQEDMEID